MAEHPDPEAADVRRPGLCEDGGSLLLDGFDVAPYVELADEG